MAALHLEDEAKSALIVENVFERALVVADLKSANTLFPPREAEAG